MDLSWLTRRPIAHRGLHDRSAGRIENSLGAARAAVEHGYAIECDVSLSADGEVVVFHDDTLERLTGETGRVADRTMAHLAATRLTGSDECIPRLADLLAVIDGRVGLVIELKSAFARSPDVALTARVGDLLAGYRGPVVTESFDPRLVQAARAAMPEIGHGIVSERAADPADYGGMGAVGRFALTHLLHAPWSRPDFVSHSIADLEAPAPRLARRLGLPLTTWTVRTADDVAKAKRLGAEIVFEGFLP